MQHGFVTATVIAAVVTLVATSAALADHAGIHGAGWANMPNDIHNTRLEDNLSGSAWRDFVSKGGGAASVNRYSDLERTRGGGRPATSGGKGGGRR